MKRRLRESRRTNVRQTPLADRRRRRRLLGNLQPRTLPMSVCLLHDWRGTRSDFLRSLRGHGQNKSVFFERPGPSTCSSALFVLWLRVHARSRLGIQGWEARAGRGTTLRPSATADDVSTSFAVGRPAADERVCKRLWCLERVSDRRVLKTVPSISARRRRQSDALPQSWRRRTVVDQHNHCSLSNLTIHGRKTAALASARAHCRDLWPQPPG